MEIIILNGSHMSTVEAAHQYLAALLHFPAYYGGNLDALADCLSDISVYIYIILINEGEMRAKLGDYADRLIAVFEEIAEGKSNFHFVINKE